MFSPSSCSLSVLLFVAPFALAQSQSAASSAPAAQSSGVAPSGVSSAPPAISATGATSLTFSLSSTNPSAIPLSSIAANAVSATPATVTNARTQNTAIPSAPSLPVASSLKPASYPPLDRLPPTDSEEVKQWIQEVQNSGINIPGWAPTVPGGCVANAAAVAETDRCWWTCSGCTQNTDITECNDKGTWGLTYDDGPSVYTADLLNYLDQESLKATFFAVGSRVISFPTLVQQEYLGGHQVSVHTWSHASLTTLTNEQIIAELGWTRKVIKDAIGVTPNTMRPPYGDIDNRVRAISMALGLTPVMWTRLSPTVTFDTGDFDVHAGTITAHQVINNWEAILGNASQLDHGFIVLEHDLYQQTVELATGYMLPDAKARGINIQPVINCVGNVIADAYVETNTTGETAQSGKGSGSGAGGGTGSGSNSTGNGTASGNAAMALGPVVSWPLYGVLLLFGAASVGIFL